MFIMVQFSANLFVNIDMGILPACTVIIMKELQLDKTWFGFLGSVVYLGQVIGSAIASGVLQKCNPKVFLSTCLFLNIITLFLFTMTDIYPLMAFCRMLTGLLQVSFAIYMPVWADAFGNETQKSKWLTYQLISSPLGVIMGYGMAASLQNNLGWRWAFYIQALLLLPSMIGLILTPSKYFDLNEADINNNVQKVSKKNKSAKISEEEEQKLDIEQNQSSELEN